MILCYCEITLDRLYTIVRHKRSLLEFDLRINDFQIYPYISD